MDKRVMLSIFIEEKEMVYEPVFRQKKGAVEGDPPIKVFILRSPRIRHAESIDEVTLEYQDW